jgi:hypothetical protein
MLFHLFLFIIVGLFLSCRTTQETTLYVPKWQVSLTESGGFAGITKTFVIQDGGTCLRIIGKDTVSSERKLELALQRSILHDLNTIGFRQIQYESAGNLTRSVAFGEAKTGWKLHTVRWEVGRSDLPPTINPFYERTMQKIIPYFNTFK